MGINAFSDEYLDKIFTFQQFDIKIITGARGKGKTVIVQKRLREKINRDKYFVYIRESQIELDEALSGGFWDNVILDDPRYRNSDYNVVGNKILVDDIVVGVCVALTTYGNIRGAVLGNLGEEKFTGKRKKELESQLDEAEDFIRTHEGKLGTVFFDEFIPIKPKLTAEKRVVAFEHLLETFIRFQKGIEVILAGNITSKYDPLLETFNFDMTKPLEYGIKKSYTLPSRINKKIDPLAVWAHCRPSDAWLQMRDDSLIGKIKRGKDDEMFTTGNSFIDKEFKQIVGKPLPRFILFNLTDGERNLTFWKTRYNVFYVTARTKNVSFPTYAYELKKCSYGVKLMPSDLQRFVSHCIDDDLIEFDSLKNFNIFMEIVPNKRQMNI